MNTTPEKQSSGCCEKNCPDYSGMEILHTEQCDCSCHLIPLHCRACTKDIRECKCPSVWKLATEKQNVAAGWKERFDEQWINLHPKLDCRKPTPIWDASALKHFIQSEIAAAKREVVEELREKCEEMKVVENQTNVITKRNDEVWNTALETVRTLLEERLKQ